MGVFPADNGHFSAMEPKLGELLAFPTVGTGFGFWIGYAVKAHPMEPQAGQAMLSEAVPFDSVSVVSIA